MANPNFAAIRSLANAIAELSGATLGYLSPGANSAGAWLAGAVPHRGPAGESVEAGKHVMQMVSEDMNAFILLNCEPELDCADSAEALGAMKNADFVISLTPFVSNSMRDYADVLLPVTPFTETSGTFVNATGVWQSFSGCVKPLAEARPAWKVLRVMGNFLKLDGFDYLSSEEIRDELDGLTSDIHADSRSEIVALQIDSNKAELTRIGHRAMYATDNIVRRAAALQATDDALSNMIVVNSTTAEKLGITGNDSVVVIQSNHRVSLPLYIEDAIPDDCAFIPTGVTSSMELGESYGSVEVSEG
jgi:NADH-quinone oxidoreductase subunit G